MSENVTYSIIKWHINNNVYNNYIIYAHLLSEMEIIFDNYLNIVVFKILFIVVHYVYNAQKFND